MRPRTAKLKLEQTAPSAPAANGAASSAVPAPALPSMPSANDLYEMIAEAAYYRAEKRGFTPGLEAEDWLHAEADVMQRMKELRRAT